MQSSQSAWGFIFDPTRHAGDEETQNRQGGKPKGKQAGETRQADSEAAPEARRSRATWETGTGRRRKRMRKMRGSPQVPFATEPAESDPGRPGDRAEGKTGRRFGGASRAESPAGAGGFTPRRKPQANRRRYREGRLRGNLQTDHRHRRKDAGPGNRSTASPAKPDLQHTGGATRRRRASGPQARYAVGKPAASRQLGGPGKRPPGQPGARPTGAVHGRARGAIRGSRRRRGSSARAAGKPEVRRRPNRKMQPARGNSPTAASAGLNGSKRDS